MHEGTDVADQILLGTVQHNFSSCLQLALDHGLGLEVQTFAFPDVLSGRWRDLLMTYRRAGLDQLSGPLAVHGAFMNMAPGSPDPLIRDVTLRRTYEGLEIAATLGAQNIVFHANFIGSIRHPVYRAGWTQRSIEFWGEVVTQAAADNLIITLENMWEPDPALLVNIIQAIDSPYLRACLDVAHTSLFSEVPFADWLAALEPYLVHAHVNNHDGRIDLHQALPDGVLDYAPILAALRALPVPPTITLEMNTVQAMEESFTCLEMPAQNGFLSGRWQQFNAAGHENLQVAR